MNTNDNLLNKCIITPTTQKCFIFDLDGTIIFADKILSKENDYLLQQIKEAGHTLIFASGRALRDFKILMPKWAHSLPMTLFGGAMTLVDGKLLEHSYIAQEQCIQIIEFCEKNNFPYIIDDHRHYYHPPRQHWFYDYINQRFGNYHITDLNQILKNSIYKINIIEDKFLPYFADFLKNSDLVIHHHSRFKSFEIMANNVNKLNGIAPFINDHHPHDVFVFGDDLNDYELFDKFHNSILLGNHEKLVNLAKINIPHDEFSEQNLAKIVKQILQA